MVRYPANLSRVRPRALPTCLGKQRLLSLSAAPSTKIKLPTGVEYNQPTGIFINNQFIKTDKTFAVWNPAKDEIITQVYETTPAELNLAVDAAQAAFHHWKSIDPAERGRALLRLADLLERDLELISSIETLDNGKILVQARADVQLAANVIRNYGGYADKIFGDLIESGDTHFNFTRREPIGVCGQIIPWNFPLLMWSWKVGPALAAGNTVVLKTAESTPLSALYVSQLAVEAGIPPGVMNIVSGAGDVGRLISEHMKIKKVAFTGSTATGRHIMRSAAMSNLKKITLELGGKSPNIVLADADIEKAANSVIAGIYYNSGEVCCAGSRVYVQDSIYDTFVASLKAHAEAMKVGDPFDESTAQGPQTSKLQLEKILNYVNVGKAEGATLLTGGERVRGEKGYFIRPTIFSNVSEDMRIVKEEIFGPVFSISRFSTVEEVVQMANATEYGLAAGLHTQDLNHAIRISRDLHAGIVWINTYNDFHAQVPFGGFNQSGIGREMGKEGLENYTQVKAVRMKIS